jgi:polygalacturonase
MAVCCPSSDFGCSNEIVKNNLTVGRRRDLLKLASSALTVAAIPVSGLALDITKAPENSGRPGGFFDVRKFGATGDGKTLDTAAIHRAIQAAVDVGGGTVYFPAGTYASYSIRLRNHIGLYLDEGATLLAADTPLEGTTTGGYDAAEPQGPWEPYQDYGHNHWHNSLIWGEEMHDISIMGPGLIWGKGLSRGHRNDTDLPDTTKPGVGNKAIALKNCYNVTLRDFSILQGGWFGILATGVDNLTIDNLKIDTNRDGMDIDCCRNVRVSNCTVNSPWDDGICPKSSFALGYARPTQNLTITNCFVTGDYELGSVLNGTWKRMKPGWGSHATGRIKCGTESNGGFLNITISNCVFESCRGFALETVDGALCEDITFTGITMRDVRSSPMFLRLGERMRGPKDAKVGTLKRIILSNIVSSGAAQLPSILSGVPGHLIEDIKISDVYLQQVGGGTSEMAKLMPPEKANSYPEPGMFGELPASGFFCRHVRNLEMSNVEIATVQPDGRPAFWLQDVDGADFFRVTVPRGGNASAFQLLNVNQFRVFGSRAVKDAAFDKVSSRSI